MVFLFALMATVMFSCGDESVNPVSVTPPTQVKVDAILPDTLKAITLDIGGNPFTVRMTDSDLWSYRRDGVLYFGVMFEGVFRAERENYKITSFDIKVEPIDPSAPVSPHPDPSKGGMFYPEILPKGQEGIFVFWKEYSTDERIYRGFTYRIYLSMEVLSDEQVKSLGVLKKK
ncbi:MAG: hypothetical protein QXO25_04425 [Candidatus Bathyarchaeia archaeon]